MGLGSGITPGPLCVMVLKSAVRSGAVAGVCVAPAPLLTDAVISALAVTVLEVLLATALAIVGGTGRVPSSRLTCPSMPFRSWLASAQVRVWDVVTRANRHILTGHTRNV